MTAKQGSLPFDTAAASGPTNAAAKGTAATTSRRPAPARKKDSQHGPGQYGPDGHAPNGHGRGGQKPEQQRASRQPAAPREPRQPLQPDMQQPDKQQADQQVPEKLQPDNQQPGHQRPDQQRAGRQPFGAHDEQTSHPDSPRPIRIVSWRADFVQALADHLAAMPANKRAETLVVFPHRRPVRHLQRALADHPDIRKPCLMPEAMSFADMVAAVRRELDPAPLRQAGLLDQVGVLRTIVDSLRDASGGPTDERRDPRPGKRTLLDDLPRDPARFLPWGVRLARLCEELLRQGLTPANLPHVGDEVAPFAAALLEQLGDIFREYVEALPRLGWTTPGADCRFAADNVSHACTSFGARPLILAGFYALSGTEDTLFHALWQSCGAEVFWHTDPALAPEAPAHGREVTKRAVHGRGVRTRAVHGRKETTRSVHGREAHWATIEHQLLLRQWGARTELFPAMETGGCEPTFVEGFDLHSQLSVLQQELQNADDLEQTAVVLPSSGSLPPVLHHLPEQDVNISMGYPLERTSLAQLLETLLTLQENRDTQGRYHWKDTANLLRHPYMKMLRVESGKRLRRVLSTWERAVRTGSAYVHPLDWRPVYGEQPLTEADDETVEPLRQKLVDVCFEGFAHMTSLGAAADALERLAGLLLENGGDVWRTHPLDAECLFRLLDAVVPELRESSLADEDYPAEVVCAVLRQLVADQRVSFEPEPLTGMQVLGMLETRLLSFRRLYVLDAVEDRLPGSSPYDPLLPDALRPLIGLPDSRERDNVAAHNFHRLLQGAGHAVILYQTGVQTGLLDDKSVRSRFVEQLLWEREQRDGALVVADGKRPDGSVPLRAVSFSVSPVPRSVPPVEKTEAIRSALDEQLTTRGLTPTLFDNYLRCPKQFFYSYVCGLRPPREIDESGDNAAFGSVMHAVLQRFLEPHLNSELDPASLNAAELVELFRRMINESDFIHQVRYDTRAALLAAGEWRLRRFLENKPRTTVLALEHTFSTTAIWGGLTIPLRGQADRIDRRSKGLVVLDYKTGSVKKVNKKLWSTQSLWERMDEPQSMDGNELLRDVGKLAPSVQLPLYMHMAREEYAEPPHNAALVELRQQGAEVPLFPAKMDEQEREEAVENQTPALMDFLVRHMRECPTFTPEPSRLCDYCDFRGPCGA